jgi:hypothetical protein
MLVLFRDRKRHAGIIFPYSYNRAIADAQGRIQQRMFDLNGELYADEFQYWVKADAKRKGRW